MQGPVLLGPQRPHPNMPRALDAVDRSGHVVYITAGWRHEEGDDEALVRDVGPAGHNLPLYGWFEELAHTAPEVYRAHNEQQSEIRKLKQLYRLRLEPSIEAVRVLLQELDKEPASEFLRWELDDALGALRGLRDRFVAQCDAVRARWAKECPPREHPEVARRHRELADLLRDAKAVLIAGGHIGVLRNRLEFFEMDRLLRDALERGVGVIGWSAGAMVLTETVVLFHDDPPTGRNTPEVLDRGAGLAQGVVVLPHARERLWLDDRLRVRLMALRFGPSPVIGVDNGAWLVQRGGRWVNVGEPGAAYQLMTDGGTRLLGGGDA